MCRVTVRRVARPSSQVETRQASRNYSLAHYLPPRNASQSHLCSSSLLTKKNRSGVIRRPTRRCLFSNKASEGKWSLVIKECGRRRRSREPESHSEPTSTGDKTERQTKRQTEQWKRRSKTTKRTNERTNERANEYTTEATKRRSDEAMNEATNEGTNEAMNNERSNERSDERTNEVHSQ